MVMVRGMTAFDMAVFGEALFSDGFGFDRCVTDAVAEKFFADRRFDRRRFTVDDGVHRQNVVFAVKTPYMDVVDADDALQFAKVVGKIVDVDIKGGGCKKQTEQTVKYGIIRDGQASFFESRVRYVRGEMPYSFLKLLEKCEKFSNPDEKQISVSVFSDDCISRSA